MTDRELQAVSIGIITYIYIIENGHLPEWGDNGGIEVGAELIDEAFEATLEMCSMMDMDQLELFTLEDKEQA